MSFGVLITKIFRKYKLLSVRGLAWETTFQMACAQNTLAKDGFSANLEGVLSIIKVSNNLMTIADNRQSLKFELFAIYPRQPESYESCLCLYSVMHEISDAQNNMNNAY